MDQTFERQRTAADNTQHLATNTVVWLGSLDDKHRPATVAAQFPRIANKLALLWPNPTATEVYLNELMFDERGGRQGFPISISLELATLKELIVNQREAKSDGPRLVTPMTGMGRSF